MANKVLVFSVCCLAALTTTAVAETIVRREPRESMKKKPKVQDSIQLDMHEAEIVQEGAMYDTPFEVIQHHPTRAPSLLQTGRICEDVAPEHTGFDVHGEDGFMKHASCEDLSQYCHNGTIGESIRVSCPVSCFICMPGNAAEHGNSGPCFDAASTGIRFRDGPKATCPDLINYCNQSSIAAQVREACKLSCGQCDIHVEGPYLDAFGNCIDLQTHEEPQFTVSGALAGCSDMAQFCANHPDSYLIRHKCPLTCGVCGNKPPEENKAADESQDVDLGDTGGCDRRRRWGFCSTRRRRNI